MKEERQTWKEKLQEFLKGKDAGSWMKNMSMNRLLIALLCGILLLIIALPEGFLAGEGSIIGGDVSSNGKKAVTKEVAKDEKQGSAGEDYATNMEKRLVELLEEVEGVGKVKVMVTLAESEEEITLKDTPYNQDSVQETDASGGSRTSISMNQEETSVLVENETGQNMPYVTKVVEPKIEGVVVLAEGAGNATIENEIIEAVEVLFPVSAHKIKVMKMR